MQPAPRPSEGGAVPYVPRVAPARHSRGSVSSKRTRGCYEASSTRRGGRGIYAAGRLGLPCAAWPQRGLPARRGRRAKVALCRDPASDRPAARIATVDPWDRPSGESPVHSYIEYKMAKFLLKLIGKERSYDLAGGCLASSRRGSPTAENRRVDRGAATGHPSASWPGTVQGIRSRASSRADCKYPRAVGLRRSWMSHLIK